MGAESGTLPPVNVTVSVQVNLSAETVHEGGALNPARVVPPVPVKVYVTVPVGVKAPGVTVTVAVSRTVLPAL